MTDAGSGAGSGAEFQQNTEALKHVLLCVITVSQRYHFVFDFFVCFVFCKFMSGLILWFMDNFWFDDLRAE